jgi:hypothetical protein
MIRLVAGPLALALLCIPPAQGLERPDREFKVFQFPPDMIPRIDGQTDDWDIVPETYAIGTDELSDTVVGHGRCVAGPDSMRWSTTRPSVLYKLA